MTKSYYIKNKESILLKAKEYAIAHKEKISDYNKKYYQKTKNKVAQNYIDNRDEIKLKKKLYYKNNKDKIKISLLKRIEKRRIYLKNRYYKNRDSILEKRRIWNKGRKYCIDKYHNNPQFKMVMLLKNRLRAELKYKGITKSFHSYLEFLGCTPEQCKKYLEKLFQDGMSWNNHGKWHIDHIIPLSKFDLTQEDQFKIACHYTNLQPLWAKENLQKGNKITI